MEELHQFNGRPPNAPFQWRRDRGPVGAAVRLENVGKCWKALDLVQLCWVLLENVLSCWNGFVMARFATQDLLPPRRYLADLIFSKRRANAGSGERTGTGVEAGGACSTVMGAMSTATNVGAVRRRRSLRIVSPMTPSVGQPFLVRNPRSRRWPTMAPTENPSISNRSSVA